MFSGLSYLYDNYHWWKFQNNPGDQDDIIQTFCMICHGITPLRTWILQKQITIKKIKLVRYLIIEKIKVWNLKNEHFEK